MSFPSTGISSLFFDTLKSIKSISSDNSTYNRELVSNILTIAHCTFAFATAIYASAPVTIGFLAVTLVGRKLAPDLVTGKVAGRIFTCVGLGHLTANIMSPFPKFVGSVVVSLVLMAAGGALMSPAKGTKA